MSIAVNNSFVQFRAVQCSVLECRAAVQYSRMQFMVVQGCLVQFVQHHCNAVKFNYFCGVQCSIDHGCAVQCSAVQCSAVQLTLLHFF